MGAAAIPIVANGVMGAAQAGIQASQENAVSKQQAKLQEKVYRENREASVSARNLTNVQNTMELRRNLEQVAGAKMDTALEALRVAESTKTAAGEAGISGASVDMLSSDAEKARLRQFTNFDSMVKDLQTNALLTTRGIDAEMISRINSVARGVSIKKNVLGAVVLGGASAAASSAISSAGKTGGTTSTGKTGGTTSTAKK